MKGFRDLNVWRLAHEITLEIYGATRAFPQEETYGITGQLRRCSASVAANIAEGCGRSGNPEFGRFLAMAMGSASELEYFLLLARDLNYLETSTYDALAKRVGQMRRMLNRLIIRVQTETKAAKTRTSAVP